MSKWSSSLATTLPSPYPSRLPDTKARIAAKCGSLLSPHCGPGLSMALTHGSARSAKGAGAAIELGLAHPSKFVTGTKNPVHHKSVHPVIKPRGFSRTRDKLYITIKATKETATRPRAGQRVETYASVDEKQDSGDQIGTEEETKEGTLLGDTKRGTITRVRPPVAVHFLHTAGSEASTIADSSDKANAVYKTERCNGFSTASTIVGGKCRCQKARDLPCCVRAVNWLKRMFDNKGVKFEHAKYREQFEVWGKAKLGRIF